MLHFTLQSIYSSVILLFNFISFAYIIEMVTANISPLASFRPPIFPSNAHAAPTSYRGFLVFSFLP